MGLTPNYSRWCVLHTNLSYFCLTSNNLNPTGSIHLSAAGFITKTAMQLFPSNVDPLQVIQFLCLFTAHFSAAMSSLDQSKPFN